MEILVESQNVSEPHCGANLCPANVICAAVACGIIVPSCGLKLVKRICLIFLCFFSMFLFTACEYNFENISNEKYEKIHEDIPADNIRNVNISGNARSIIIKQGVTDNFEFYNADLDENNQYEVEVTYDEEGNDFNILVTMDNAEASNDVLGSVVVSIPKNEFEKIEITGEFIQVYLCTLNSDVFVRTNSARVVMDLLADQLKHNITLVGSESNSFSDVMVYFDKLPENVKMELPNIPQSAISAPSGLLTGDKLEPGSGKPIISINNADKLDFYVEKVD